MYSLLHRETRLRVRRGVAALGAAALLLILSGPASAQVIPLFATIDGQQESTPNGSPATGIGVFNLDPVANTLHFNIGYSGLIGTPTVAHIHGPAIPGVPAGILFPFPNASSPIVGTWNYPDALEADILEGRTYVNIHTDAFPDGEIRGQIINARSYCWGDGSATPCPCTNPGIVGRGCTNSTTFGGLALPHGGLSAMTDDLQFTALNLIPGQPALLFSGRNNVNGGMGFPFGDGLRCAGMNVKRLGTTLPDAGGIAHWGPGLQPMGGWGAGDTRRLQVWYRDPVGGPCGSGFNLSNGIELEFTL